MSSEREPSRWQYSNDWLFVVGCFCVALSCAGWLLYRLDKHADSGDRSGETALGLIKQSSSTVKLRSSKSFLWNEASRQSKVYSQDSVQTGRSSTAYIEFSDGESLQMGPESLVFLSSDKGELNLDIAAGDLYLAGQFKAKLGGKTIASTSDNAKVSISSSKDGQIRVETQGGDIEIQENGESQKLEKGQVIQGALQGETKITEVYYNFLSPQPFEEFRAEASEQNILFSAAEIASEIPEAILEISQSKDFKKSKNFDWLDPRETLPVSLEDGLWLARIKSKSTGEVISGIQSFKTTKLPSLAWRDIGGRSSLLVTARSSDIQYSIAWKDIPKVHRYRLSLLKEDGTTEYSVETLKNYLTRDENFTKHLKNSWWASEQNSQNRRPASEVAAKEWQVRIQALDQEDKDIVKALTGTLRLVDERPAPNIASVKAGKVDLEKLSRSYELTSPEEIRPGTELRYSLMGREITSQSMKFEVSLESLYEHSRNYGRQFKVYLVSDNGKQSPAKMVPIKSEEAALPSLIKQAPKLLYPSQSSRLQKSDTIELSWNSESNSNYSPKKYLITINHKKRDKVYTYESKTNSYNAKDLDTGNYTWSVQAEWPGEHMSPPSRTYNFEVIAPAFFQAPTPIRSPASEDD